MKSKKLITYLAILTFFLIFSYSNAKKNIPSEIQAFSDENVKNFVRDLLGNKMPDTVIDQPKEYLDVVKMGKSYVPYLIDQLNDSREYVRIASLVALDDITKKYFGEISDFEDSAIRSEAWGIAEHPSDSNGEGAESRNSENVSSANYSDSLNVRSKERMQVIREWRDWWKLNKNKSRIQWLVDDLGDPNELVRREAVIELGVLKERSSINELKKHLSDQELRPYINQALKEMGPK